MNGDHEGLTRGELLRRGLLGLTALTVVRMASSCREERRARVLKEAPEEKLDIGYREVAGFSPGFHTCRGLAVRGDDVWVAGDMAVRGFKGGKPTASFDLPGAAQAVGIAPDGAVFAALDDRVVDLSSGTAAAWEPLGPRARLVGILATGKDVLAADAGNRQVLRYGRDGAVRNRIGVRDPKRDYLGLIVPSPYLGLALLPSGELAVCNPGEHRIEVHSLDGRLARTIGKSGQEIAAFCGCCNPMSLAVLAGGDLVTAEKGIPRVKVIAPDGSLRTVVAPPTAFDVNTTGLELAVQNGRVLVLDPWEGAVRVFEPI